MMMIIRLPIGEQTTIPSLQIQRTMTIRLFLIINNNNTIFLEEIMVIATTYRAGTETRQRRRGGGATTNDDDDVEASSNSVNNVLSSSTTMPVQQQREDDDDDDMTIIGLDQDPDANNNLNTANQQSVALAWIEQNGPELEERRRSVLIRELERVQRLSFFHFILLCLIPMSLLVIDILTVLGEDEECQSALTHCETEPRTFINAFTTRCVCDAVDISN